MRPLKITDELERIEYDHLLKQAGDLRLSYEDLEALQVYKHMLDRWPNEPTTLLLLGGTYFSLKEYELAIGYLKEAVQLMPDKEFASIGLFFSLWKIGKVDAAYKELERFVSAAGQFTDEYDLILKDIRGEITDEEFDQLDEEIRQKKLRKRNPGDQEII